MGVKMVGPRGNRDELFASLVETSSAALFAIYNGLIQYANPAAHHLAGYPAEHLLGKPFLDLIHAGQRHWLERQLINENVARTMSFVVRPDLTICPVEFSFNYLSLQGASAWMVTAVEKASDVVFQSINEAALLYGMQGNILLANPGARQYFGFDPTGLTQGEIAERLSIRDLNGRVLSPDELFSNRALRGETIKSERLLITNAAGEPRFMSVSAAPVHQSGSLTGAVVIWYDITEQEQLLQENRRQRELLETIFAADPGGLAVLSGPELRFAYANLAYRQLTPHPDVDPTHHSYDEIWPPEEGFTQSSIFRRVIEYREPVSVEGNQRIFPDGSRHTFSIHALPVHWNNEPAVLDVVWETTTLDEARQSAEQLASQLDTVINSIGEAVIIFNTRGEITHLNPAAEAAYGFDPMAVPREEILKRLHATHLDGRPLNLEETPVTRALRGEMVSGQRIVLHYPDGREGTSLVTASPMLEKGEVTGAVVVWRDVTERENLVATIEEEQARLQAVISNAPEAILMTDASGRIILANPAAEHLYGHPLKPGTELGPAGEYYYPDGTRFSADDLPITRAIRDGVPQINQELVLRATDGEQRILLASAAPLLSRRGRPFGAVGVFQDINQLKRAEQTLKREAERMELLASLSQSFAEAGLYYPSVLGTISHRVAETIGEACIIRLSSDDGLWLDPVASHHTNPQALAAYRSVLRSSRKPIEKGLIGSIYQPDQPLLVLDMTNEDLAAIPESDKANWPQHFAQQNALLVPLRAQGRFIGTLTVVRSQSDRPFSTDDQVFVQDLADRAALAIENARLYAAEAQRAHELEALHRAATVLLANLDLDNLIGQILETARDAIPAAEQGMLHLAEVKTGELKVRATMGFQSLKIQKARARNGNDFLLNAVRNRQPALLRDFPGTKTSGAMQGVRSAIVAPLILGEEVVGALSLTSSHAGAFGDSDLRLLVSLAATTTAAFQNALLHSEVQRLAVTDELTGLYNRRGFFDVGEREVKRHQELFQTLSIIMLDIDHFKDINDQFGHPVGDQVLVNLARRCRAHVRQVDILGRYGGEEFAILLPETEPKTAREIAERIRHAIDGEPVTTSAGPVGLSISLGVTSANTGTITLEGLLAQADEALYKAKEHGRNRVEIK